MSLKRQKRGEAETDGPAGTVGTWHGGNQTPEQLPEILRASDGALDTCAGLAIAGHFAGGLKGAAGSLFAPAFHARPGLGMQEIPTASLEMPLLVPSPVLGLGGSARRVTGNRPLLSLVPEAMGSVGCWF